MALLVPPEDLQMTGDLEQAWPLFKQRFLLYLKATGAAEWPSEQKVALFLTIAGPEALHVYNTFQMDPEDGEDFEAVLARFESHCMPRRNETYERFLFRTRLQELHESLEDFAAALQYKSRFCNFGAQREPLVRDQIVLGCRSDRTRQQLLQQDGLSLEGALQICRLEEAKEKKKAQKAKDLWRPQELTAVKKQTQFQVGNVKESKGQVSRRKVRHVRNMGNPVEYWQQQSDNCHRKESLQTYV